MSELTIRAEFAAAVWRILVEPGADVSKDQELLILESMKTEIPVAAPSAGRVTRIEVGEGDTVEDRQALIVLDV